MSVKVWVILTGIWLCLTVIGGAAGGALAAQQGWLNAPGCYHVRTVSDNVNTSAGVQSYTECARPVAPDLP